MTPTRGSRYALDLVFITPRLQQTACAPRSFITARVTATEFSRVVDAAAAAGLPHFWQLGMRDIATNIIEVSPCRRRADGQPMLSATSYNGLPACPHRASTQKGPPPTLIAAERCRDITLLSVA